MKIGPAVRLLMPIITQFGKTATKKLKKRDYWSGCRVATRLLPGITGQLPGGACFLGAVTDRRPGGACGARG